MRRFSAQIILFLLLLTSLTVFSKAKVYASDGNGLAKPEKFTAVSGPMAGEVTLFWDQVPDANRYAIAYGENSGVYVYGADNIGGEQARSYTVKSLKPGVTYYFVLSAANGERVSGFSHEVSATALGGYVPQLNNNAIQKQTTTYSPMSVKQTDLKAYSGLNGRIDLFWNDKDAENYHLVYGTESGKYQYGALNIGRTNKYTVSHLMPGAKYYFQIIPVKGDRAGSPTNEAWAYAGGEIQGRVGGVEIVETKKENLIIPRTFDDNYIPPTPMDEAPPTELLKQKSVKGAEIEPSVIPTEYMKQNNQLGVEPSILPTVIPVVTSASPDF